MAAQPAWFALFTPSPEVSHPEDRQAAWLLTLLLAFVLPLTALSVLVALLMQNDPLLFAAAAGLVYVAYLLSRTRFFRVGGLLAIFALTALPLVNVLSAGRLTLTNTLCLIESLVSALFITYILYRWRGIGVFMTAVFGGLGAVMLSLDGITLGMSLPTLKLFITLSVLLMAFALMTHQSTLARQHAEARLRASEEHYRHISEMMSDIAFSSRVYPDGRYEVEWVIGAVTAITGLSIEEIRQHKLHDLIHPDDLPLMLAREARLKHGGYDLTELRIINREGQVRWLRIHSQGILENGKLCRIYGAIEDTTRQRQIEADAAERMRLNAAVTNTSAAISSSLELEEVLDRILSEVLEAIAHDSGNILLIHDGIARVVRAHGFAERGLTEALKREYFVVDDTANMREMIRTGQPCIIEDTALHPNWVQTEASSWIRSTIGVPIRLAGQTIGFLNLVSDQPNTFSARYAAPMRLFADQAAIAIRNARLYDEVRRHAEQLETLVEARTRELELERRRLQIILDGTGEGIFYTENKQIQYANEALCRLSGYTQAELIGQPRDLLRDSHQPDEARAAAFHAVKRGEAWRNEIELRRKDGSLIDVGLTLSRIDEDDDGMLRTVALVRDISREKALQLQRSNLVAHASHELRTPITNLKTRLYLLRRQPDQMEAHLQVLEEVAERMRRLISDLLDISRLEHGLIPLQLKTTSLSELVERAVQVQQPEADRKGQCLHFHPPPAPLLVDADADRMTQVITNLLTNAIHYTGEGGSITVSIQSGTTTAAVQVEDTGVGIAQEQHALIFEPFYRAAPNGEGTGLGLSIARQIVEMHGGARQPLYRAPAADPRPATLSLAPRAH